MTSDLTGYLSSTARLSGRVDDVRSGWIPVGPAASFGKTSFAFGKRSRDRFDGLARFSGHQWELMSSLESWRSALSAASPARTKSGLTSSYPSGDWCSQAGNNVAELAEGAAARRIMHLPTLKSSIKVWYALTLGPIVIAWCIHTRTVSSLLLQSLHHRAGPKEISDVIIKLGNVLVLFLVYVFFLSQMSILHDNFYLAIRQEYRHLLYMYIIHSSLAICLWCFNATLYESVLENFCLIEKRQKKSCVELMMNSSTKIHRGQNLAVLLL